MELKKTEEDRKARRKKADENTEYHVSIAYGERTTDKKRDSIDIPEVLPEQVIEEIKENGSTQKDKNINGQKEIYLEEMKKAIEDKKNAEIQMIIGKMKDAEKHALELLKAEEESKTTLLKKKMQAMENKAKKKDDEIEQLKSLTKLKQTNFVETIQSLTKEFAEKSIGMNQTILLQQEQIIQLEQKLEDAKEKAKNTREESYYESTKESIHSKDDTVEIVEL